MCDDTQLLPSGGVWPEDGVKMGVLRRHGVTCLEMLGNGSVNVQQC